MNLTDLQYVVLPSRLSGANSPYQTYNQVYEFWKEIWSVALKKMDLPALDHDEFLRQDYVCALFKESKVVACHLYSIFDVRTELTMDSRYFSQMKDELKTFCSATGTNTILTQEYLAVSPDLRKQKSMISLPEVVVGLATRMMKATQCDATGGTVRDGAPSVDRVSREIGCIAFDTIINRYNIDHRFFVVTKDHVRYPGDKTVHKTIDALWNSRIDYTRLSEPQYNTLVA